MFSLDQNYLQRLVESSPDIVVAVDHEGFIIYYNDGARRSLHYTPAEIIGQKVTRIYPSLEEAQRVMKAMRDSSDVGKVSSLETVFRSKDNEDIPVAISGSVIYDEHGEAIGSIGFARDIRRMRQREQLATAGEIAVSLAHEINNPLESITNNLELLARDVETHLSEAERVIENERIESIRLGVRKVQAIVKRLDEMARAGKYLTRDYMQGKRMTDLAPREMAGSATAAAPNGHPREEQEWPLSGMAVLVLDDDVSVVNSLCDILRAERCVVYSATRPSAAFGIIRNMKVDAVLSDVVMPEMDGYEFYLRVKEEFANLPCVLMTAYYYDKDHIIKRSKLRELEGAIFKKPVNPAKLRQMLCALRQNQAGSPRAASIGA